MTYEELKSRVKQLSERLDAAEVPDASLLEMRIELRQLLNRLDIAALPTLESTPLEVDVDALIVAVDRDILIETKRANLIVQIGKVVNFVKTIVL